MNNIIRAGLFVVCRFDTSALILDYLCIFCFLDKDDDCDDGNEMDSFNPTKEIESIDERLNALQTFLRAAKAGNPF